jgi:hypothetical protein
LNLFGQVMNKQISIVRLSQMFVDSDTINDIQLEAFMLFGVRCQPTVVLGKSF